MLPTSPSYDEHCINSLCLVRFEDAPLGIEPSMSEGSSSPRRRSDHVTTSTAMVSPSTQQQQQQQQEDQEVPVPVPVVQEESTVQACTDEPTSGTSESDSDQTDSASPLPTTPASPLSKHLCGSATDAFGEAGGVGVGGGSAVSSPSSSTSPSTFVDKDESELSSEGEQSQQSQKKPSFVRAWRRFTQWIHYGISVFVSTLSLGAARNPKSTLCVVIAVSVATLVTGLCTNFYVEVSEEEMFSPNGSAPREHRAYLENLPGYPDPPRNLFIMIHKQGHNVLEYESVDRLFHVLDTLRMLEDYDDICSQSSYVDSITEENTCRFVLGGPTRFWSDNSTLFRESTKGSDELTRLAMSSESFPGGSPVAAEFFLGKLQRDNEGLVESAQSLLLGIELPPIGEDGSETKEFEGEIIASLLEIKRQWEMEKSNAYRVEFSALRTFPDETERAIVNDIPLIPFVFVIMTLFTMSIFWRRDKVQSRTLLGVGSVVSILLSIMTGYGLAFIIGIPFTSMTQILPFVVFGVGLDDTFIITGAYFRTDPSKDTLLRIQETVEEVGSSISLTTITTTVAFLLGVISTIPCIRWLCFYAAPTIFFVFIYQITFFFAVLVIDEKRIQEKRRDCLVCVAVEGYEDDIIDTDRPSKQRSKTDDDDSDGSATQTIQRTISDDEDDGPMKKQEAPLADRFMAWYADRLLLPKVKVFVLVFFTAFLAGCAYSATLLTQEFKAVDFLPDDSYAASFLDTTDAYVSSTFRIPAVFRDVDQSDPEMQKQMMSFVHSMGNLTQFGSEPDFCWMRDFQRLKNGEIEEFANYTFLFEDADRTFSEQLKIILNIEQVREIYGADIALDAEGNIESSRCWLTVSKLDLNDVDDQINMFQDLQRVMKEHPINQGREDLAFFSFDIIFFLWEFYVLAVEELWATTISGIVAITVIGFLLIPHWSATLFVTPLICVLYVDLLGTIQFAGLHINPLTYVCLVVSIGLLVDFLMHIMLRYYESTESTREEKVKDTLRTMGASILVGGLSTCLGVVPLAFSTSGLLKTVFICFISMVSLGVGHGLILLPVLLSYLAPEVCVRINHQELAEKLHEDEPQPRNISEGDGTNPQSSYQTEGLEKTESSQPFKAPCTTSPQRSDFEQPPILEQIESGTQVDVDNLNANRGSPLLISVDTTTSTPVSPYSHSANNQRPVTPKIEVFSHTDPTKAQTLQTVPSDIDPREIGIFRTNSSGSIEV